MFRFVDRIWKSLSGKIETVIMKVPQQKNEYDCGLFVLYFIRRFMEEAPDRLKKKNLAMVIIQIISKILKKVIICKKILNKKKLKQMAQYHFK